MGMKFLSSSLKRVDEYYRLANYISVGQIYLMDNPLLKRPLEMSDLKKRAVGHFGTVPAQNFIYAHLNRVIKKYDLNMIYISGPGHGGNSVIANTYIEGTYSKMYPGITEDSEGLKKLFKNFSFPGGVSSHASPEVPGSIHEGGELGYSLSHACGAVIDNPDLIASCVIGDGEAETGPLLCSFNINKILNPITDGVVLPIINLNGYKIANPTVMGRMSDEELYHFFVGFGYEPYLVSGSDINYLHNRMAKVLDKVITKIKKIKEGKISDIKYPLIILRTPKGMSGPKEYEGKKIEGTFRSHQIPIPILEKNVGLIEEWLKSYNVSDLFDENGTICKKIKKFIPDNPMGLNKNANGGLLLEDLNMPNYENYAVSVPKPGVVKASDTFYLGKFIKDIFHNNPTNFIAVSPDETASNRLSEVFNETSRKWTGVILKDDENLAPRGRVIDSILSEHVCEGILEGYILTGRHGFINSYEAFIRIVDSMASQHAKWLKMSKEVPWRTEISSLNILLTSHIWQQDHNGFTHQDPGFLNHLATKKADTVRMYLPIDANTLINTFDHILRTKNYINVVVASKHESLQWLSMSEAKKHCEKGIGKLSFISNDKNDPDIVLASCGDTPNLEIIAAADILRKNIKDLKIRVINVIDLMKLQTDKEHPHGLNDKEYDKLFTKDKPIIFAFHGYPNLIHQLTYKRNNKNLHVKGYMEEGTITTPFDMRVRNKIDRFNLVKESLKYIEVKEKDKKELEKYCDEKLKEHKEYIRKYGVDLDEITNWKLEK